MARHSYRRRGVTKQLRAFSQDIAEKVIPEDSRPFQQLQLTPALSCLQPKSRPLSLGKLPKEGLTGKKCKKHSSTQMSPKSFQITLSSACNS